MRAFGRPVSLALLSTLGPALMGCQGFLYGQTGDMMTAYTADHVLPAMMQRRDTEMACETGVSFGVFLMSFGRVTDEPQRAGAVAMLSAGFCAETAAKEAQLQQLRALHEGRSTAAQDSRIVEKRHHLMAARRFSEAFGLMQEALGEVGKTCPEIEPRDELLMLLGLAAGLNALMHDRAAEGQADVSLDTPAVVSRASQCLDDDTWWGVPLALRAAMWASVPALAPPDTDPWTLLDDAARRGERAGVRLARALQVQAASSAGRDDIRRRAIEAHVASLREDEADPAWRMLDQMGTEMILHESDVLWTAATGHRTPFGGLGTFFDTGDADDTNVDDSLLDDLGAAPDLTNTRYAQRPAPSGEW